MDKTRIDHEADYHPAFKDSTALPQPAGKALLVIVIALAFGIVFNSAGVLHLARGMREGIPRDIAVGIMEPINTAAHTVWLDRPKQLLDQIFGHELDATGGAGLADGDSSILRPGHYGAGQPSGSSLSEPAIVSPTTADPLRLLVIGDSLSTFIGQQLDDMSATRDLVKVRQINKDGTGINTPEFFNWQAATEQEVAKDRAQAVVMVIGGSDSQTMTHNGQRISPGTDEWETEYARRVAVIMKAAIDSGAQRIYWSGPPVARSRNWDASYARISSAVRRAAEVISGARQVDLYHAGTGTDGASTPTYSEFADIDGQRVRVRQPDGLHWTYAGSQQPAEQVSKALQRDYGSVL